MTMMVIMEVVKRRKGRRRKGDKNSAADVLGVMERRKEAGK
jgi:hypothetical protein